MKWILLAAVALLFAIIVVLVLLLRRAAAKKKRAKQQEEEDALLAAAAAAAAAAAVEEGLDEEDILNTRLDQAKKTREQELRMQIGEFADLNPEIAAQLIKTWLKGGSGNDQ